LTGQIVWMPTCLVSLSANSCEKTVACSENRLVSVNPETVGGKRIDRRDITLLVLKNKQA